MTVSLLIQKLTAKTMSVAIQKSTVKNCVAADSEIGSQKLCRCRLRIRQPKTLSLPIQNSTAKTVSLLI
jgi:hypothetical protein